MSDTKPEEQHVVLTHLEYRTLVGQRDALLEALEGLVHRCDAEGCGTAWAPLTDARAAIYRCQGDES